MANSSCGSCASSLSNSLSNSLSLSGDFDGPVSSINSVDPFSRRSQLSSSTELVSSFAHLLLSTPTPSPPSSPGISPRNITHYRPQLFPSSAAQSVLQLSNSPIEQYTSLMAKVNQSAPIPQNFFETSTLCPTASSFVAASKNRYTDALPTDIDRLVLQHPTCRETDYINANSFAGLVITQGPLKNTLADFWMLLFEQNVSQLVCLTNHKEPIRGQQDILQEKTYPYWNLPENSTLIFDTTISGTRLCVQHACPPEVVLKNGEQSIERALFYICFGNQIQLIEHWRYINWPDHGASDPDVLSELFKRMYQSPYFDKIAVHCSAGLGRSGVFAVIKAVMQNYMQSGILPTDCDVIRQIIDLRSRRPGAVQNSVQLRLIFQVLAHLIQKHEQKSPLAS